MEQNSFDFFDRIYCINLDRRYDRWETVCDQFDNVGITDRVKRISGREVKEFEDSKRNAAYGNHLSHAACIRDAKEYNAKNCLIFEDDVLFINNPQEILKKCIYQLSFLNPWELFYLGANIERPCYEIDNNLAMLTFAYSTHAYAINSQIFDELIEINENKNIIHNDVHYNEHIIPRGKSYICKPMLAIQQPSYSDIEEKFVDYNWMEGRYYSNYVTKCGKSNQLTSLLSSHQWEENH